MKQVSRFVVSTRPEKESAAFIQALEKLAVPVLSYPTIAFTKNSDTNAFRAIFNEIETFDWIIFTSRNGVDYFIDALKTRDSDLSILKKKYIAAVGSKTEEAIKKYGLPVHAIPKTFTNDDLIHELPDIAGKKVLLPRSNIAAASIITRLEEKGAIVTPLVIYKTQIVPKQNKRFISLLRSNQILCISFTSPSTVQGFIQSLKESKDKANIFNIPILSIGPVTSKKASQVGFQTIYTADIHTVEGMLTKLKENIL